MAAGVCFEVPQGLRSSGGGGFLQGPASQRDAAISRIKTGRTSHSGLFDAVPFTPSQGVCAASPQPMSKTMFSPFASFHRDGTNLGGGMNSDGSSNPELSMLPNSADGGGLSGYSPFMGVPWGNSVSYMSETTNAGGPSPLELPSSPMSPGVLFNPSPSGAGLGAPGSPCSLFGSHSPNPYSLPGGPGSSSAMRSTSGSLAGSFLNSNASAAADAAAAAAAAAFGSQLPAFYYQAAAAAAGGAGAAAAAAASNLQLQAALSQTLLSHPSATLAAAQQQQQLLQASLSAALAGQANPFLQGYPSAVLSALEPMRSAGGSLSLDGGLQQQASVQQAAAALLQQQQQQQQVAAAVLQQQHHQHAALRRNLSTPAAVAAQLGLGGAASAQLGLQGLGLSGGGAALQLPAAMGRLHVTHSADLSALDAAGLLAPQGSLGGLPARPKFKARKNSEPKIGPDGQPRLNARQRRTLRRAKERALKGLLEVSQALLQKAEVQVTVPNISHLTALEELAAVEAEKEEKLAAAGGDAGSACLSPGGSTGGSRPSGTGGRPAGVTRSQQLAAAAAAVEESVCEIARAAVAAVTAQATGRDTGAAAAAAQAAAAQAASAAASAGAVLPPGFVLPEVEEPHSEDLPGCGSDPLDSLSHSAPTSPVGSSIATGDASGRSSSSSSSSGSLPASGRCSSSSGSVVSPLGAAKPPVKPLVIPSSPLCSPLPSPSPAGGVRQSGASQLEGIDIAGLIGQLSLKKDEGMVDEKLIRDLQIIQSLIGALRAPSAAAGLDLPSAGGSTCASPSPVPAGGPRSGRPVPGAKVMPPKRSNSYSPGTAAGLAAMLPH